MKSFDNDQFLKKLHNLFEEEDLKIDIFNDHITYIEIDCLADKKFQLYLELKKSGVGFSKTLKESTEPDFSLPDFYFDENSLATAFLEKLIIQGEFPER